MATGDLTDASDSSRADPDAMRTDAPDATFTNGRYELPRSARGVLVLADPPEAGWRLQPPASEPTAAECTPHTTASALIDRQD
jgi:hypothetical protein